MAKVIFLNMLNSEYSYLFLQTKCNRKIIVSVIGFYDHMKQAIDYHITKP